jgi:zona occludens toxin
MIYLVTGTPGAGKSLYAVSTLVRELVGKVLKRKGQVVNRRLLVDGVTGLLLPHDKLAPGLEQDDGSMAPAEGQGIWNWWEWCQPGDVIFVDEVQRWFRPRGMGTKPPPEIKHLETHRHLGVDFVFVTQNPMLLDQNIRRLVYRHQHIRRLFGLQRAVIYEWDGCAENVKSTKAATMSQWAYPRSAYDLYQSSELHTKPKVKVPVWAMLPVLALVGLLLVAPKAFSTMQGAMSGKGVAASSAAPAAPGQTPDIRAQPIAPGQTPDIQPDLQLAPGLGVSGSAELKLSGCVLYPGGRCKCLDVEGRRMDMDVELCGELAQPGLKVAPPVSFSEPPLARVVSADELDVYSFLKSQRGHKKPD